MENIVLKKKSGQIEVMNLTSSIVKELSNDDSLHLCWGNCRETFCKHACSSECEKIAHRRKRPIDEYEDITDGFQVLDKNRRVIKFVVTGCRKYEPAGEKKLTLEEKEHIKDTKKSLRTLYFEASDIDEAYVTQYMGIVDGIITNVGGKMLPEKSIMDRIVRCKDAEQLLNRVIIYKAKNLVTNEELVTDEFVRLYGPEKVQEIANNKEMTIAEATQIIRDAKYILMQVLAERSRTNQSLTNIETSIHQNMEDLIETRSLISELSKKLHRLGRICSSLIKELELLEEAEKAYYAKVCQRKEQEAKEEKIISDLYKKGIEEKKIVKRK